jgi:aryl-alcohol dehydrogenase-like predicted oxidoreductase
MSDQMGDEIFDYVRSGNRVSLLGYTRSFGARTRRTQVSGDRSAQVLRSPENDERAARLELVARETGYTINQVLYAWMINGDRPSSPSSR